MLVHSKELSTPKSATVQVDSQNTVVTESEPTNLTITASKQSKIPEIVDFNEPIVKSFPIIKIKLPASPTITSRLLPVVTQDSSVLLFERLAALEKLGKSLTKEEIAAFYEFLNRKDSEIKMDGDDLDVLKNDISTLLQLQKNKPKYYAHNLMAMFYNQKLSVVWRDYTVQHLAQWYRKEESSSVRNDIRTLFATALQDTSSSIAGTALIALDYNIGADGITSAYVAKRAVDFVHNPDSGSLTRTTALQIAAQFGQTSILNDARSIAVSREPVPLRMSAIAAIGMIGSEQDIAMLNQYSLSSDVRLRTAAVAALKKIRKRKI